MKITYLRISGWGDAIRSLYMSLSNYTPELELKIKTAEAIINFNNNIEDVWAAVNEAKINNDSETLLELQQHPLYHAKPIDNEDTKWWDDEKKKLVKYGNKHITLMKFIDITVTVVGLHRGAQDDLDAHAERMNSRIIRMSTRTKNNEQLIELSDYYKGKILPFHELNQLVDLPVTIRDGDILWQKTALGYVNAKYIDDKDVRRGHIPLAISSNFTFKIQVCENCHVFRERCDGSAAHPELQELMEMIIDETTYKEPLFTREMFKDGCWQ